MTSNPSAATPGTPEPVPPAPPADKAGPPLDEPEGRGFLEALKEGRVSYAFIAAAIIIFWLSTGGGDVSFDMFLKAVNPELARKYGAFDYLLVRQSGEWWRYATTLFVSRLGLDLVIFGFIFLQIGPQIERVLGSARFFVLYLAAGAGGVALAEIMYGGTRNTDGMGDTIVACYAAFGALPGVILGATRSLRRTVQSPEAQSAAISIAFWTFLRFYITKRLEWSIVGAALLGMLLAAGLTITKSDKKTGAVATAVPLLIVALLIGLAASGKRWLNGKLTDRGVPATGRVPGSTEPPPSVLDPPEASSAEVEALKKKLAPFLVRFGPLPSNEGVTGDDKERAAELLAEADQVANGANVVLGELDPERIKLNILLYNKHAAAQLARDYLKLQPGAYARALAGLTAYQLPNLDQAGDHLDLATRDEQLVGDLPEVLFYYGKVLDEQGQLEAALAQLQRYVRALGDGPHPPWRQRLVDEARGRVGR